MADSTSKFFNQYSKEFSEHIKDALEAVAPQLVEAIQTNIDNKGYRTGFIGEPVEPWIITENPTPLIDTGELYDSFESRVEEKNDDYVLIVSTPKAYASVLNEGGEVYTDVIAEDNPVDGPRAQSMWEHTGDFSEKEIPKREFMRFTIEDVVLVEDAVDAAVQTLNYIYSRKK